MLAYLLDEHISYVVAEQLALKCPGLVVHSVYRWRGGELAGRPDRDILDAAAEDKFTLVSYDLKTIPDLLAEMGLLGKHHAGVIFVDIRTISANDFGALVRALAAHWCRFSDQPWEDRVAFLALP